MSADQSLTLIKIAHTAIWAVMAAAIVALPVVAALVQSAAESGQL